VANRGVFDVEKALVAAFNGNPFKAAAPKTTMEKPVTLITRQIGHSICSVRGLHSATLEIELVEKRSETIYIQVCSLDRHGSDQVETIKIL